MPCRSSCSPITSRWPRARAPISPPASPRAVPWSEGLFRPCRLRGRSSIALHHHLIGKAARLYWYVRRPRTLGVRAIVLDPSDRIALVRHSYLPSWYLPGGGVDKGESFEFAMWRELREEIAIVAGVVERLLGAYHSRRESKDDHILVFVVRVDADA